MNKMTCTVNEVKYQSAADWPNWTDNDRWFPTEADDAENASLNDDWDDDAHAFDDPIWDVWAAEAEAARQLEQGIRMF